MPDRLPPSPPASPMAARPFPDSPIASPRGFECGGSAIAGPNRPCAALAGKAVLEKATAQVFTPDLHTFTPNKAFANEAELKRNTVFNFMKDTGFNRLENQTRSALQEACFLDTKGKPVLMNQATLDHCMKAWGFTSTPREADSLEPDLYELYQVGLPKLALAMAVLRELRTQSTDVDAQSQAEIRQALRSLFAHGLTVCTPGVIQNIEEACATVAHALNPPDLAGELKRRTIEAAVNVLAANVHLHFSGQRYFENNQIHMVTALKNALAGRYGLEKTEDKYASADYATTVLGADGNGLNKQLDGATAPHVLCRSLAADFMQQVRNRLQAEGLAEPMQRGVLINEMANKFSEQYAPCSPYTIGHMDPDLGLITQASNSLAPLAIALLQQGQRQGLFEISENHVAIPRQGQPDLNLLLVDHLVCAQENDNQQGGAAVLVPLTVEELLPDGLSWLQDQLGEPEKWPDGRPFPPSNPGVAALFEALQNSKGGMWSDAWKSGAEFMPIKQAEAFLDVMSVQTPELSGLFGRGSLSARQMSGLLHTVAHGNQALFNQIPTPVMETWLDRLSARLDVDSRYIPIEQRLSNAMFDFQFTPCKPLVEIALKRGIKVDFRVVEGDLPNGRASTLTVVGPDWVGQMVKLAPAEKKKALLEAMTRATLIEMVADQDKDKIGILDALRQQGACVFTNQANTWQHLCNFDSRRGLARGNLNKLLSWTAHHAAQQWQPQALSLLYRAINNDAIGLSILQTYLGHPARWHDKYEDGDLPGLDQAHQDYKTTAKKLLARQDFLGLQLAFQFIDHFQSKGFPNVDDAAMVVALNNAIEVGFVDVVRLASDLKLVPPNAVLKLVAKVSDTPILHDMAASRMAGYLLDEQYAKSDSPNHWALVNQAILGEKPLLANLLLRKTIGVDALNQLDRNGFAPLHHCARSNHDQMIHVLVAAGADINIQTSADHNCKTPLHYAMLEKNELARKALIELGANAEIQDARGRKPGEREGFSARLRRLM